MWSYHTSLKEATRKHLQYQTTYNRNMTRKNNSLLLTVLCGLTLLNG